MIICLNCTSADDIREFNSRLRQVELNLERTSKPTCPQKDDLVVQRQLGEVRDPLGPLHQGEELLVGRLADVGHWIVGLQGDVQADTVEELRRIARCIFVSSQRVCFGPEPGVTLKPPSAPSCLSERSAVKNILERGVRRKTKQATSPLKRLEEEIPAESCRRTNNIPQTDALRGPFSPHTNHPCGQLVGPGRGPKLQSRMSTRGTGNNRSANKNGHILIINATHTHTPLV